MRANAIPQNTAVEIDKTRTLNLPSWRPARAHLRNPGQPDVTAAIFFARVDRSQLFASKFGKAPHDSFPLETQLQQIDRAFRSVRQFHPNARAVVLTDDATPIYGIERAEVLRSPIDASRLMWHRLLGQRAFIATLGRREVCLFMDDDIVINRSLYPLFAMGGDVLLTWRYAPTFINAGFMGVRGESRERALTFFDHVAGKFRESFWQSAGDQEALCAMFPDIVLPSPRKSKLWHSREYDVLFLPCSLWNHSPFDTRYSNILWRRKKPYVLHFKGKRKRLAERYWQLYLEPRSFVERARLWVNTLNYVLADEFSPPLGSRRRLRRLQKMLRQLVMRLCRRPQ